jgi:hypothetical protein
MPIGIKDDEQIESGVSEDKSIPVQEISVEDANAERQDREDDLARRVDEINQKFAR